MIRTLIVDDQELVRSGFAMILDSQSDIEVIGEASDGQQAVTACANLRPDVVLMDVRMPVMDGIEATRRITTAGQTRILMLTTFDLDQHVYDAFKAGASGFLLKDVRRDDLIHAVRAVSSGDRLVGAAMTGRLLQEFVSRPPPGGSPEQLRSLTNREIEILELIGRGMSNAEIASQLIVAESTVKTHVSRIFTKLEVRDRVQAVVLTYETGLVKPGGQA